MSDIEKIREEWRTKAKKVAKNLVAPRAAEIDAAGEFAWDIVDACSEGFVSFPEYGGWKDVTSLHCLAFAMRLLFSPGDCSGSWNHARGLRRRAAAKGKMSAQTGQRERSYLFLPF
jgi:hypothetical protein